MIGDARGHPGTYLWRCKWCRATPQRRADRFGSLKVFYVKGCPGVTLT
jgi:hypothetical protein